MKVPSWTWIRFRFCQTPGVTIGLGVSANLNTGYDLLKYPDQLSGRLSLFFLGVPVNGNLVGWNTSEATLCDSGSSGIIVRDACDLVTISEAKFYPCNRVTSD